MVNVDEQDVRLLGQDAAASCATKVPAARSKGLCASSSAMRSASASRSASRSVPRSKTDSDEVRARPTTCIGCHRPIGRHCARLRDDPESRPEHARARRREEAPECEGRERCCIRPNPGPACPKTRAAAVQTRAESDRPRIWREMNSSATREALSWSRRSRVARASGESRATRFGEVAHREFAIRVSAHCRFLRLWAAPARTEAAPSRGVRFARPVFGQSTTRAP